MLWWIFEDRYFELDFIQICNFYACNPDQWHEFPTFLTTPTTTFVLSTRLPRHGYLQVMNIEWGFFCYVPSAKGLVSLLIFLFKSKDVHNIIQFHNNVMWEISGNILWNNVSSTEHCYGSD